MKIRDRIAVFLVDDDRVYLTALTRYLRNHLKSKIELEQFVNGEDCLGELERNPTVEVVILDYYLSPGARNTMQGPDVLKRVKEINPDIIVIMLTSEDKLEIARDCITNGAYEYVVKSETAFIRIENTLKNLIHEVALMTYYPADLGGEA